MRKYKYLLSILFITSLLFTGGMSRVYAESPYIGMTVSQVDLFPPEEILFGRIISSSIGYSEEKVTYNTSNNIFDGKPKEYPMYKYILYAFEKTSNLVVINEMPEYRFLSSGVTFRYQVTKEQGTTISVQSSATTTLSSSYSESGALSVGYLDYANVSVSAVESIESSLSGTISNSFVYTYTSTITEEFEITATEGSYYRLQTRGMFDVFVLQVYTINYMETNRTHVGLPGILGHDEWDYDVMNYTLYEQSARYKYLDDTMALGFYKFIYSNSRYIYDDVQEEDVVYL